MQTANTFLMIEPVAFGYNSQTAENNYFQVNAETQETQAKALKEFNTFVEILKSKDVNVIVIKDTLIPHTPDSIFPNNWISFDSKGNVFLYPMFALNRRSERRMDILEKIKEQNFKINNIINLSKFEETQKFLEGTGSMIFDHDNRIAYGSVSLRLDEDLFRYFCQQFNFKPVIFHAYQTIDTKRMPIYHTNVMMCVADDFVVICLDAIDDAIEKKNVIHNIQYSNKEIITITENQMQNFAGNMLQIRNNRNKKFLVMSQRAYKSLNQNQINKIENYCEIIYTDLNTIETNGGGSARCMLAEIFLPKKD